MKRRMTALLAMAIVASLLVVTAPPGLGSDRFVDVPDDNIFHNDIGWMAEQDITRGCNPPDNDEFCPSDNVTRGQMAAFFVRALGLTATDSGTDFTDTDGNVFERDILKLSAAGITRGCNPPDNDEFCPDDFVTRGQMAAFFVRALNLTSEDGGTDFTDTDGNVFERDILRLSAAGITRGCNPPANDEYCPDDFITREQMAAFFHRADGVGSVALQILAINDFHGNIGTTGTWGDDEAPVGRADYLASYIRAAEAEAANSIFVSAGDLIGASPLISALFQDEPTIEAMNLMGLDLNAVGNHEFDEGPDELLRMQNGGAHPTVADADGEPFQGADFEFLAANVEVDATGDTLFPPYSIRTFWNERVAFIGMTLEGTPEIVTQEGVAGLTFHDEVETVNALVPELQAEGIEAIVVLLHEGGFSEGGPEGDDCEGGLTDPLNSIVTGFDDAVDLVIAGHVNDEFVCEVDGKWVTMADNAGRLFTDIDTFIDRGTGDLVIRAIDNVPTYHEGVAAASDLTELIDKYDELSAEAGNTVIGSITEDIPEVYDPSGETAVGNLIADAQLAATDEAGEGEAVVAFMNNGGVRTDAGFVYAESSGEGDGNVTYAEAFAVQPFGNSLVTITLTGQQIHDLLEQQFQGPTEEDWEILHVSEGFTYTWDYDGAVGDKVDPTSITIGGNPLDLDADYRVTVNSFLAGGGDGFSVLLEGTDPLGGDVDLDALVDYFGENSPIAPPALDRIDVLNHPDV
ncbi:MAG TPA: 5'-nucleotidase C-terminal domain-containing protein [Acidimicrobiia bacterium]|nr:5'-nucleotidase C-terminal domain-containing protein [Acidimicrobiia bacterium]